MEYGLVPKINQYSENNAVEVKKVQSSQETAKFDLEDSLAQIKQEAIKKDKQEELPKHEVKLANTNFGYNRESQDFYVKSVRGKVENQYPTEQMMKIKSHMMELAAEQRAKDIAQ